MKKERFYQWLDTVCKWMMLTEKPVTCHPGSRRKMKKLSPELHGAPVVLEILAQPMVCRMCSVIVDTSQVFSCRRQRDATWAISCSTCRRSIVQSDSGEVVCVKPKESVVPLKKL